MRALVISEIGVVPQAADVDEPVAGEGDVLIEMLAAPLNPIDVAIGNGRFYAGHPDVPYVPCVEGVGTTGGRTVYAFDASIGLSRHGAAAQRFVAKAASLIEVPEGADPATAAVLGVAGLAGWLPITWRADLQPGESVLVLGATGATGQVAVQAARHAGAGRIVAAGRNEERLAALADLVDATVSLAGPDVADALDAACRDGVDVVYDPVWGAPVEAAVKVARPGARIVSLGQSAGSTASFTSATVRGKQLNILGYSNFAVPREVAVEAYRTMVGLSTGGLLKVDYSRVSLGEAHRAWQGQLDGAGKFVIVP